MARRLELTSYNCGNITSGEYDDWVAHVILNWDRKCGLDVTIDQRRFGEPGDDVFDAKSPIDRLIMREALEGLWEDWCSVPEAEAQTQR